jgi:hypothetical protein
MCVHTGVTGPVACVPWALPLMGTWSEVLHPQGRWKVPGCLGRQPETPPWSPSGDYGSDPSLLAALEE